MAATATGALDRREDAPLARPGAGGVFVKPRSCYVCKTPYRQVDAFYHRLCPDRAADNTARRGLTTDLSGRRALLTGGRVKIGFQLALMMLRDGAELLVTSRFPHDTMRRFRAEPGSAKWWDRLTVLAVDLRDPRQVLGICEQLRQEGEPLDILVNNAAQTVRRPAASYALLAAGERAGLPEGAREAPGFTPMRALASWSLRCSRGAAGGRRGRAAARPLPGELLVGPAGRTRPGRGPGDPVGQRARPGTALRPIRRPCCSPRPTRGDMSST